LQPSGTSAGGSGSPVVGASVVAAVSVVSVSDVVVGASVTVPASVVVAASVVDELASVVAEPESPQPAESSKSAVNDARHEQGDEGRGSVMIGRS
jgi:hypothetical protein